jgi:hypothetical protein
MQALDLAADGGDGQAPLAGERAVHPFEPPSTTPAAMRTSGYRTDPVQTTRRWLAA